MSFQRERPPSMSALVAFRCAARHRNFSRAAEELNTSQSAVSRHVAALEARLGVALFDRVSRGMPLTEQGEWYYRAVVTSLESLRGAERAISARAGRDRLTIACTHEISHLFVMPRFAALQAAVGDHVEVRVLTSEYEQQRLLSDDDVDMRLVYGPGDPRATDLRRLFAESVRPVCSRHFLERHRKVLARPMARWRGLPVLDMWSPNLGWATWDEYAAAVGMPAVEASSVHRFGNYVYLLEAAAAGRGMALGWAGLVERYLEAGTLVAPPATVHETTRGLFARITERTAMRPPCLRILDTLCGEAAHAA